jgi:galactosyl transferase GMA12/MNN10 family
MKFLIISANNSFYKDVAAASNPNLIKYSDLYYFDHKIYTDNFDTNRPAAWSKLKFVLENMCNYDYIMWIDCDAKITNFNYNVLNFLDEKSEFLVSKDNNGINSGVFIVKCTEYMAEFLLHTYKQAQYTNHCWWEQAAINELFRINYSEINQKVKYLPQEIFNSYISNWNENSFILHCPALQLEKRVQILESKESPLVKYENWIRFKSRVEYYFDSTINKMGAKTNWIFLKPKVLAVIKKVIDKIRISSRM